MSDFDDKLGAILGDQNAMEQIMALAQSLSAREGREDTPVEVGCADVTQGQDARLLAALRPYLKHSRQKKLDRALELLQLLRLFRGGAD